MLQLVPIHQNRGIARGAIASPKFYFTPPKNFSWKFFLTKFHATYACSVVKYIALPPHKFTMPPKWYLISLKHHFDATKYLVSGNCVWNQLLLCKDLFLVSRKFGGKISSSFREDLCFWGSLRSQWPPKFLLVPPKILFWLHVFTNMVISKKKKSSGRTIDAFCELLCDPPPKKRSSCHKTGTFC